MTNLKDRYFSLPEPYTPEDERRIMQEKIQNMPGAVRPISEEKKAAKLEALQRLIASSDEPEMVPEPMEGIGEESGAFEEVVNPDDMGQPIYDEEILKKQDLLNALKERLNME